MISSLPLKCGFNVGGIRRLEIVAVEDVVSIPEAIRSIVDSAIVLKSGVTVAVIEFPQGAGGYTENQKDTDAGSIKVSKLTVPIPKDAPELGHWANLNDDREVIALYKDENGVGRIIGDLDRPVVLNLSFGTGTRSTDKNQFEMVLEGISDHYAYYYTPLFTTPPASTTVVYSAGYTFGFKRVAS